MLPVPVGIITHNRARYLDLTLRSLSAMDAVMATYLSLTIYDDGSDDATRAYYDTDQSIPVATDWPTDASWSKLGLQSLLQHGSTITGLNGRVRVVRLGDKSQGVVQASCLAVKQLFQEHPWANRVVLLQDDVLFQVDWLNRLLDAIWNHESAGRKAVGVLAGMKLNHTFTAEQQRHAMIESGITAQCLCITRLAFERCQSYFTQTHKIRMRFDDTLRRAVAKADLWAGCMFPFVCQHFGICSKVRPKKTWSSRPGGRIGIYAPTQLAMQETVRKFAYQGVPV